MNKGEQNIIIGSLVMDLKRVALGLQRGSLKMADRFKQEALKREAELETGQTNGYLKRLVMDSKKVLLSNDANSGEDILMYSILFQNFSQRS